MRVAEAKPLEDPPRRLVLRMMSRKERARTELREGEGDRRLRGFSGEAQPPVRGPQMEAELEDAGIRIAWLESAAACEAILGRRRGQIPAEYRPVLDPVFALAGDLRGKPRFDRGAIELRPRIQKGGHPRIAPKRFGERQVRRAPRAEGEPLGVGGMLALRGD
jgi:hypothetical protein